MTSPQLCNYYNNRYEFKKGVISWKSIEDKVK